MTYSAELRIFFAIFVQNDDIMIIGRTAEIDKLRKAYESEYSQFVTVYGRRRVGKTFLVRETFDYTFTFEHAGLANSPMKTQLKAWQSSLKNAGKKVTLPKTWIEAFDQLKDLIKEDQSAKKVIFIDEMPWMDTLHSGFVSALAKSDIGLARLITICGSLSSRIESRPTITTGWFSLKYPPN